MHMMHNYSNNYSNAILTRTVGTLSATGPTAFTSVKSVSQMTIFLLSGKIKKDIEYLHMHV